MANSILIIRPYWSDGTWVFDDPATGLVREPFVAGVHHNGTGRRCDSHGPTPCNQLTGDEAVQMLGKPRNEARDTRENPLRWTRVSEI